MLKKAASFVLASLRGSTYDTEYDSPLRSLRPCLGQGAFRRARVGRVRSLAFLSILLGQGRYILMSFKGLVRHCVGELLSR